MRVSRFDTPAGERDLPASSAFHDDWHRLLTRLLPQSRALSGPGEYVDPSRCDLEVLQRRSLPWSGFPRPLLVEHRDDRSRALAEAEERGKQIEYLEWHVEREGDRIRRVTFTTETPEYWKLLALHDPDRVLALYRELVGEQVRAEDLYPDGGPYDPMNRWNTRDGIVHFVMPINSMRDLLGVSQEEERTGARDGLASLPYKRTTGADARINVDLWALTRQGLSVATADPPGPSILGWDDTGWSRPDGTPVGDYWRIVRGRPGEVLRLVYEVPPEEGFLVGDLLIGGRPVRFGSQLAEHITVAAHVVAGRRVGRPPTSPPATERVVAVGGAPPPAEPAYDEEACADVQGNVFPGFAKDLQCLVLLSFDGAAAGGPGGAPAMLRWLAPRLTSMAEVLDFRAELRRSRSRARAAGPRSAPEPPPRSVWTSLALSFRGLATLVGTEEASRLGDEAFRQGLAARSTYLGDPAVPGTPGHRDGWVVGGPGAEADLLVTVAADDRADLDAAVADVLREASSRGLGVLLVQHGATLPGPTRGTEHFGFRDGVSQPGVRGVRSVSGSPLTPRLLDDAHPHAGLMGRPGQMLLWPGQLLLGEPRQDPQTPWTPGSAVSDLPRWARRGSYLVFRRLAQDVDAFWAAAAAVGDEHGVPALAVASALVGRWPSGAPLARAPGADDPALAADDLAVNDFLYDSDTPPGQPEPQPDPQPGPQPDPQPGPQREPQPAYAAAVADTAGVRCPHVAHVRQVNPRDGGTDLGAPADTLLRLMFRRGIPYGPPRDPHGGPLGVADGPQAAERGLLFLAYMASVEDQFETVSRRWASSETQPQTGGVDPLVGRREPSSGLWLRVVDTVVPGLGPCRVPLQRDVVVPTGGGYFFAPPISAVSGVLGEGLPI